MKARSGHVDRSVLVLVVKLETDGRTERGDKSFRS